MPASRDVDSEPVDDWAAKAARGGHVGEGGDDVEVGNRGGRLTQWLDMCSHLGYDASQQVGFQLRQDLLSSQDPSLGFLELGRDIASGVGQRLPDLILGWQDRWRFV